MAGYAETPKWKLNANWLLKELIFIWRGHSAPGSSFNERSFVNAFMHVMEQYLQACGSPAHRQNLTYASLKEK